MITVHGKIFGLQARIYIPEQLPGNLYDELFDQLKNKGRVWINKEIREQANDLKVMLENNTHKDTGRMSRSWVTTVPVARRFMDFNVDYFNIAFSDRGYYYPTAEEYGNKYRPGHFTTQKTIQNDFLPTVIARMKARLRGAF